MPRPLLWLAGVVFAAGTVALYHRAFCPGWYERVLNPATDVRTESVVPVAWVHAAPGCRAFSVALLTRTGGWEYTQLRVTSGDADWDTVAGTVTVVEDAEDATMRLVERVQYRQNGAHRRRDYVIHVNPLGRGGPECHPGIWFRTDRPDVPRKIWLPRPRGGEL